MFGFGTKDESWKSGSFCGDQPLRRQPVSFKDWAADKWELLKDLLIISGAGLLAVVVVALLIAIRLAPIWIGIICWKVLGPQAQGFWQKFAVVALLMIVVVPTQAWILFWAPPVITRKVKSKSLKGGQE